MRHSLDLQDKVLEGKFQARFGGIPKLYRAPGRVNLIGEHTDYNEGFVMPAALDFSCWVAAASRDDGHLVLYSENLDQSVEASLKSGPLRPRRDWSDYVLGVAATLQQAGYPLRGANLYIWGEVPLGAGLSSSAAIEVAVAYALADLLDQSIDRVRLASLCQRAENEFVGARCGIMDQFIACHGQIGHALLLDCRSLDFRLLRLPEDVHLVICNTMVKHEHASSSYNLRRSECEEAVRSLAEVLPQVRALRDVTGEQLAEYRDQLTTVAYKRARHVVSENKRVLAAASALENRNMREFGGLMLESHASLRHDYEASCQELDLLVEIASRQENVYGTRMTGGGFGGCTISLVSAAASSGFRQRVSEAYHAATGLMPDIYVCRASQGVEAVLRP
jgi:galactokinase